MEQKSDNWLAWRDKGIGSSDAPVVMGVSPWKTAYQLWEEKTGKVKKIQEDNWAIERGNRLEPIARAKYELETDISMEPAVCQHERYEFLKASMDGWNPMIKRGLEIKFAGKNDHELAKTGHVPEKYWPQVQHQFLVTGATQIDYYSYYCPKDTLDHQGEGVRVETKPDMEYIRKYFEAAVKFWKHVTDGVPPGITADDFKTIRLIVARQAATEWKALRQQIDKLETQLLEHGDRVIFKDTGVRIFDGKIEIHG